MMPLLKTANACSTPTHFRKKTHLPLFCFITSANFLWREVFSIHFFLHVCLAYLDIFWELLYIEIFHWERNPTMSLSDSDYEINPLNEKCIPCPPQTSYNNISPDLIPEWYNEVIPCSDVAHAKKYAKNDFLTPSLIGEIQSLFPTSNHIDSTNNHSRSKTAFSQNCEKLFQKDSKTQASIN